MPRADALRCFRIAVPAVCLGLLLALPGLAIGGTIYSWQDSEGIVHFANRKPPQGTEGVREIRYKPSKGSGGLQAGRGRGPDVRPKAMPETGGGKVGSVPASSSGLPIPTPAPVPAPARAQISGQVSGQPAGSGAAGTRVALDELRGLDPEAVKAIYSRLLRECGPDPQCRKKVDDLMQGVRPK